MARSRSSRPGRPGLHRPAGLGDSDCGIGSMTPAITLHRTALRPSDPIPGRLTLGRLTLGRLTLARLTLGHLTLGDPIQVARSQVVHHFRCADRLAGLQCSGRDRSRAITTLRQDHADRRTSQGYPRPDN
jgi:hypothetical protein